MFALCLFEFVDNELSTKAIHKELLLQFPADGQKPVVPEEERSRPQQEYQAQYSETTPSSAKPDKGQASYMSLNGG